MSCKVENLEKNMAKLTIEVSAAEFEKACEKAYQKNKTVSTFRASVRVRLQEALLKRCMVQQYFMKMLQMS